MSHEDNFTTYKLFYAANKVAYKGAPLHFYRQRNDSIMGRAFDARRLAALEAVDEAEKFFGDQGVAMEQELLSYRYLTLLGLITAVVRSGEWRSFGPELSRALRGIHDAARRSPHIYSRHKFFASVVLLSPTLYAFIRRFV